MKYLLLLLLPSALLAESGEDRLRHSVFNSLHEALSSNQPAHSAQLLAQIAATSNVPAEQLRPRLVALLDSLDALRKREDDTWKTLILQGEPDIGAERAGKLLRYLSKEGRKVLASEGDILLDSNLRKAARKSKLPLFQARTYVLRSLEWAMSADAAGARDREVGLLVGGSSNRFEVALDPLFIFFDTQDEAFVREQVRQVQRFIIPAMVRRLPESERILWAVRERESNALVVPDYHLRVGVDNIRFTGSNADLKPCIELGIELYTWQSKSLLMQEPFSFCSEKNGSATTSELAPFWDEVADAVRGRIEEYLAR